MLRHRALAYFALLFAVFIWGVNFVVVEGAIKVWQGQEFTFLAARFWLACIVYGMILIARHRSLVKAFSLNVQTVLRASLVGIVLTAGYGFQTWYYVKQGSAVGAAFLTSTTVIWASILALLFRQRVYATTLIGACLAMVGILLIEPPSTTSGFGSKSWLAIFAAVAFAIEILLVSRFAPKEKSIQWTTVSCLSVASLMTVIALFYEKWDWPTGQAAPRILTVIFTGTFATAIALGLQNWAQAQEINRVKIIDGPRAAIIATLEPVFTTLAVGILILIGLRKADSSYLNLPAVGCLLILVGTLVSEFAAAKRSQKQELLGNPDGATAQS
jgi:drug/metabolite transporter (DMT)-like permease